MPRFLLSILCILCFMSAETQAKVHVHRETAHEDRELPLHARSAFFIAVTAAFSSRLRQELVCIRTPVRFSLLHQQRNL